MISHPDPFIVRSIFIATLQYVARQGVLYEAEFCFQTGHDGRSGCHRRCRTVGATVRVFSYEYVQYLFVVLASYSQSICTYDQGMKYDRCRRCSSHRYEAICCVLETTTTKNTAAAAAVAATAVQPLALEFLPALALLAYRVPVTSTSALRVCMPPNKQSRGVAFNFENTCSFWLAFNISWPAHLTLPGIIRH